MDRVLRGKKPHLIKWLRGNSMILQYVDSEGIITPTEYTKLKNIPDDDTRNGELLDFILQKGPGVCQDFLVLLKTDDVNESNPELRDWIKTVNISDTSTTQQTQVSGTSNDMRITAVDGSNVIAPVISNTSMDDTTAGNQRIADNQEFLRINRSALVRKVKNVVGIVDDLTLSSEMRAIVEAMQTDQARMRKVLDYTNSTKAAQLLIDALWKHAPDVMEDLTKA